MNRELIEKILQAAVMAPSGDNVQPWRFGVSKDFTTIDLYNLPDKDDSYYNYEQVACYIAHGAVIENILIAARHLGASVAYQLFPDQHNKDHVACFTLSPATAQNDPYYDAIFNRYTNRFTYQRAEPSEVVLEALNLSVKDIDGIHISLVSEQAQINELAKTLMVNDRLVFERKDIHGFLFDKIRWNQKQVEETQDGMPINTLGLSLLEKPFFPLMRFWAFVKTANLFGLSRIVGLKCWWNCKNASVLGMLSAEANDKMAFIQAGRGMQRVWLEATVQNLAFQPIVGLPLLIYRMKQNVLNDFSKTHRQQIRQVAERLPIQFNTDQKTNLLIGFRLGSYQQVTEKTWRKAIDF